MQGLAVLVYLGVERIRQRGREEPFRYEEVVGPMLPEVELLSPDGARYPLGARRGKTMLLHFWATWCPPCRGELPGLLALQEGLGAEGRFEVLAVSMDDDWAAVRDFFGGTIPRAVMKDPGGRLAKTFGVSTLPDTYLIDPDGAAVLRFGGSRNWRTEAARDVLRPYVRVVPTPARLTAAVSLWPSLPAALRPTRTRRPLGARPQRR